MDQELAKLLDKKRAQASTGAVIDWDDRRNKYLAAVGNLYRLMTTELDEAIQDRTVQVQRRPKNLTESDLGTYSIDDLIFYFGDEQIRFSPKGRNIVGAEGRVDVVGERSEATLILRQGSWFLVQAGQLTSWTAPFDGSMIAPLFNYVMRD